MSVMWSCRNERQVGEGTLGRHGMCLPTVALADVNSDLEQFAVDAGRAR